MHLVIIIIQAALSCPMVRVTASDVGLCASALLMQVPLTIFWSLRQMNDRGWLAQPLQAADRIVIHLLGMCSTLISSFLFCYSCNRQAGVLSVAVPTLYMVDIHCYTWRCDLLSG